MFRLAKLKQLGEKKSRASFVKENKDVNIIIILF